MAFNVDAQVYIPSVIPKPPAKSPGSGAGAYDSTQRSAQAFVDSLPPEVRERIGQQKRNPQNQPDFNQTDQAENEALERKSSNRPIVVDATFEDISEQPFYSSPNLTPGTTLLQAQLSAQEGFDAETPRPTDIQRAEINDAYITAGAQAGGRTAALEAQIQRQERNDQLLIVPPVLTSVNLSA